jgi:hypothetical protein
MILKQLSKQLFLYTFLCYSSISWAEVSKQFSIGLSQTNNLELQENENNVQESHSSLKRQAIITNLFLSKKSLDYTGGYRLSAQFSYNKGLDHTGDIQQITLSASQLNAFSRYWLMRSSISLQYYESEPLPVSSYTAIQLENTLGYLQDNNAGMDINIKLRQEKHNKHISDHYKLQRTELKFHYYFPHHDKMPYWTIYTGLIHNNTDSKQRDFQGLSTGLEYRQWLLGSFNGTVGLQRQSNQYLSFKRDKNEAEKATETFKPLKQNRPDTQYNMAYIRLIKPLKKSIDLELSANIGRYQTPTLPSNENFYQLSSYINWNF